MNLSAITSFDENFKQLSMSSPEPTFEKTINEIEDNYLKVIASDAMNLSAITLFDENFDQLSMNNRTEAETFEPEPRFEKTINEIKANILKSMNSIDMNVSSITSNKPSSSSGN